MTLATYRGFRSGQVSVLDLGAICAAARKCGAILGVGNTFATPLHQRPLTFRVGFGKAVASVKRDNMQAT
jgi:O-acetylhomoserine/O-acetylserine sulfhydrylase-like pyridoxal-dependent enzyme